MKPKEYRFDESLAKSDSEAVRVVVRDILMANIPGASRVYRSSMNADRGGVDFWVDRGPEGAGRIGVDVKVRDLDFRLSGPHQDDLVLETKSNVERGTVGWTIDERKSTDYVLWLWPTARWCLISFPMLCAVTIENLKWWMHCHRVHRQRTPDGGYHSECVIVPRWAVMKAIERRFGGDSVLDGGGASS